KDHHADLRQRRQLQDIDHRRGRRTDQDGPWDHRGAAAVADAARSGCRRARSLVVAVDRPGARTGQDDGTAPGGHIYPDAVFEAMTESGMLSLVIPVYNNEGTLPRLFDELERFRDGLTDPLEVVFVVDGSPDRSLDVLAEKLPTWGVRA